MASETTTTPPSLQSPIGAKVVTGNVDATKESRDTTTNMSIEVSARQPSAPAATQQQRSTSSNSDNIWLIIFGCCSTFFYAGAFYGWGPLQLLLESNGNFQNECSDEWWEATEEESTACPEQTSALLTSRFVGQLTVLTSPLWAYLSDKYGGQTLTYNMFGTMIAGLVLLIIAFQYPGTKWDGFLLYTSFILIGIGSTCGGLLTVVTALLFHDTAPQNSTDQDLSPSSSANSKNDQDGHSGHNKTQSRVISLMNSLYDAAAITYLTLWGLVQLTSNVVGVMIGYACFAVIFLGGFIVFFQRVRNQVETQSNKEVNNNDILDVNSLNDDVDEQETGRKHSPVTQQGPFSTATATTITDESISKYRSIEDPHVTPTNDKTVDDTVSISMQRSSSHPPTNHDSLTDSENVPARLSIVAYVTIAKRSFLGQIGSKAFILLCTFFTIHFMSNIWTLTTMRDFLKYLGDDEVGNKYLAIFTLLTPVSLVALPFVDVAIHRYGYSTALQAVNTLDMIHCLIKVIPGANLNIQIIGFVVFSFFRCFLFCVTLSSMPTFVSGDAVARATSVIYVISSAATFINIPLVNLAVESNNGNFFIPNLFFLFLTIPGGVIAWLLGAAIRKDWESHPTSSTSCMLTN